MPLLCVRTKQMQEKGGGRRQAKYSMARMSEDLRAIQDKARVEELGEPVVLPDAKRSTTKELPLVKGDTHRRALREVMCVRFLFFRIFVHSRLCAIAKP